MRLDVVASGVLKQGQGRTVRVGGRRVMDVDLCRYVAIPLLAHKNIFHHYEVVPLMYSVFGFNLQSQSERSFLGQLSNFWFLLGFRGLDPFLF